MNGSREVSADDGRRLLDRETRRELGVPVNVFLRAYDTGDFPAEWDRAALSRLEMLLPMVEVAPHIRPRLPEAPAASAIGRTP